MPQKTLYIFAFSFLLFVLSAVIRYHSVARMNNYVDQVNHSTHIITTLQKLSNHFKSVQLYSTDYEVHVASNLFSLYQKEGLDVPTELATLDSLIKDDSHRQKQLGEVTKLINKHLPALFDKSISQLIDEGEAGRLADLFRISSTINMMTIQEEKELDLRREKLNATMYWNNIISFVLVGVAATIIISTFIINLRINRKQKWLEGFLESVLNSSKNGIISFSPLYEDGALTDFKIEYANNAINDLLGLKPGELIGQKATYFTNFMSKDSIRQYIDVVEKQEPLEYENYFSHDGVNRWVMVRLAPREKGFTATYHDITALKKTEEKLKQSIQHLERSNKELEQYAYAASHDLQEPLRKIQTFSNYLWELQGDKLDEKGRNYLRRINASSQRMSTLIKDILNFSSVNDAVDFAATDLNSEVSNVLQDLELLINQKGATIEKGVLPQIDAIPLQIRQLFYNLVYNALKFTAEDRPPHIKISARKLGAKEVRTHSMLNDKKTYFELVVEDNGIGFSNAHTQQIFSLFKRLNSKDDFEGSGIGLALCLKVVQNHQGVIYARGEEGKGARFYVILPQHQYI